MFMPHGKYNPSNLARFDLVNATQGGKYKMIFAGFTIPINAVLYCGADESTLHKYQWQSDTAGNAITLDATIACQNVTKNACAKLKKDPNVHVYVVKYRVQPGDYSYIDACASDTSSVYNAENEAELKGKLKEIAKSIKDFAGYEKVKVLQNL
jgi:hypothetical protein